MSSRHRPCEHCRKQHLKCEGYPVCMRCKSFNRECQRVETKWRFRHNVPLPYARETSTHPRNITGNAPGVRTSSTLPAFSPSISAFTVRHAARPLSAQDACLLRYFVEDLSRWFDLTDPRKHFATAIPQRARECSTLLDAILSVSARHFSTLPLHTKTEILRIYGLQTELSITEETVIHYHNRCIAELRILSDRPDAVMDENLLAAVVILRFFEELDNPFTSPPTETALHGLHVFLRAQASSALDSSCLASVSIRQSAFWVGFRQEFNLAFAQQRTTRLPLEISAKYLEFSETDDYIWTNRLIVFGARILNYCYGQLQPGPDDEYSELVQLRDQWVASRPRSFAPFYSKESSHSSSSDIFPKIWYMEDCHIVAAQTLSLLDILLAAYSPSLSRPGIGLGKSRKQNSEIENTNARIRALVLDICGMALSNRQSRPAGLTACIAINLNADRFTDQNEQRALMELVIRTTKESNYWPTSESERRLRVEWGWDFKEL
ncbi:hypothetical protein BDV18DRAFT_107414 [Aspergillus unguis]